MPFSPTPSFPGQTIRHIAVAQKAHGESKLRAAMSSGLAPAEPDFDTPDNHQAAAIRCDQSRRRPNTRGFAEFPELAQGDLRPKFKRENKFSIMTGSRPSSAPAGKQILFNAFMATLNAGDEVIIPCAPTGSAIRNIGCRSGRATSVFVRPRSENSLQARCCRSGSCDTPKNQVADVQLTPSKPPPLRGGVRPI